MAGPRWVRIDTHYLTNPKIMCAGPQAMALHLASICYCAEHDIDDGVLSLYALRLVAAMAMIGDDADFAEAVRRLVEYGLWHSANGGTAWRVHDYAAMNGVDSEAYRHRRRQAKYRARLKLLEDNG